MKKKRLRHAPNQFCQMFCGWQIHPDLPRLAELGTGTLEINVLDASATFQGAPVAPLLITTILREWFVDDLERHSIPMALVREATLKAQLELIEISWTERRRGEHWFDSSGHEIKVPKLHRCRVTCEGRVVADDAAFVGSFGETIDWPPGWPAGDRHSHRERHP